MREPTWRTVLNYGCVIYFLGLPALAIFLGLTHIPFAVGTNVPKFLADFHFSVSALVAAVAGLNSFDRRTETKVNGRALAVDSMSRAPNTKKDDGTDLQRQASQKPAL